jgi:hypothetical protein
MTLVSPAQNMRAAEAFVAEVRTFTVALRLYRAHPSCLQMRPIAMEECS